MPPKPPPISDADRHRQWIEKRRESQAGVSVSAEQSELRGKPSAEVKPKQTRPVEFYVYINAYPHDTATLHKGQCSSRAHPKGVRLGPFTTKDKALARAAHLRKVRGVHLCRRCKP